MELNKAAHARHAGWQGLQRVLQWLATLCKPSRENAFKSRVVSDFTNSMTPSSASLSPVISIILLMIRNE